MSSLNRMFLYGGLVACLLAPFQSLAKRMATKPVPPVVSGRIRYSAAGDGRDQYIEAANLKTGKVLWKMKTFHNAIEPGLEKDVQWVFISNLKLAANSLLVKDERSRCYAIDLTTKRVENVQCGSIS